MSATATANSDSSTTSKFDGAAIREALGIQTQPAEALAQLNGWDELRNGVANGRDWEELDGVGPSTAEALAEVAPNDIPGHNVPGEANDEAGSVSPDEDTGADEDDEGGDGEDTGAGEDGTDEHNEGGDGEDVDADEGAGDEVDDNDAGTDAGSGDAEAEGDGDDGVDLYDVTDIAPVFKAMIKKERIAPVFDAVSKLVDETKVRIGEDRVSIRAVDPANVGMVDIDLNVRAFESYQGEPGVIGINLDRMNDILSTGNKGDIVTFNLDSRTRKLHIEVGNLEYTMALIDPDSMRQEPDLPDLELSGEVVMSGGVFGRLVNATDMVSEHMSISYDQDTTIIEAEGDTDDVRMDLSNEEAVEEINNSGDGMSLFSLDYLKNFKGMVSKKTTVNLRTGDSFPLKIHFNLADDHADVEGMLAPRIQSD